jgi:hypothetical protein
MLSDCTAGIRSTKKGWAGICRSSPFRAQEFSAVMR